MKSKLVVVFFVVFMPVTMLVSGVVEKVEVTVKMANIRSLPSLKGKIVGKAVIGEIFKVEKFDGSWYKVLLKKGGNKYGFLHKVTVKEVLKLKKDTKPVEKKVTIKKVVPLPKEKIKVKEKKNIVRKSKFKQKKLFSGFYLKGGLITKPKVTDIWNGWILDLGFDSSIGKYLTWGIEFQPYFRTNSNSSINLNEYSVTTNIFLNLKGGVNLGTLWESVKFLTVYVGGGIGGSLNYIHINNNGTTDSEFKTLLVWHIICGTEVNIGKTNMVVEFQINKFIDPAISWVAYTTNSLLVGLRF